MKKGILIMCAVSFGVLLSNCSSSVSGGEDVIQSLRDLENKVEYETVDVAGLYTMDVPDYMSSTTDLNAQASLQYSEIYKEEYVIVINESKEEAITTMNLIGTYDESLSDLENFAIQKGKMTLDGMTVIEKTEVKKIKSGGLGKYSMSVDATSDVVPQPVNYNYGFVEGEENFYTIMTWTLISNKEKFQKVSLKMIKSFEEQ